MTTRSAACPACEGARHPRHYLCGGCWHTLTSPARRALTRRDDKAGMRLLELHRQLRRGVALHQIEITP
jgi:hypothetical protein